MAVSKRWTRDELLVALNVLRANVREVVKAFYFDQPEKLPSAIRLHLVRDEVRACA